MPRQSLQVRGARTRQAANTRHTPAAISADRRAAIALMNAKCARKLSQLEKSINDTRSNNLRFYYNLGGQVLEIRNNPDEYTGTDGTPGLQLIERALSTQARALRKAALFAETYSEAELTFLVDLHNTETNFQLHYGHVTYLLSIPTAAQRREFAYAACSEMWDPATLHATIKRRLHRRPGHGRPHTLPATVTGQIRQIAEHTRTWVGKYDQVWDGEETNALADILDTPPDDITDELLEMLVTAHNATQEMSDRSTTLLPKLDRIIERFQECLAARKRAEAQKAATTEATTRASGARRERRAIDLDTDGAAPARSGRRSRQSA